MYKIVIAFVPSRPVDCCLLMEFDLKWWTIPLRGCRCHVVFASIMAPDQVVHTQGSMIVAFNCRRQFDACVVWLIAAIAVQFIAAATP
jgi:hypothetical protein